MSSPISSAKEFVLTGLVYLFCWCKAFLSFNGLIYRFLLLGLTLLQGPLQVTHRQLQTVIAFVPVDETIMFYVQKLLSSLPDIFNALNPVGQNVR